MIWFIGPKRWSNISRHIDPPTMGEIIAGRTRRATNSRLPGRSAWKCRARSMPRTSWIGSATAMIASVRHDRPSRAAGRERALRVVGEADERSGCVGAGDVLQADDDRPQERKQADEQQDEDGRARRNARPGSRRSGPSGPLLKRLCRPSPSLPIGGRLRRPDLVGLALLVDADALGDLVPFGGERVERRLRVLAADRRDHRPRHRILVAEGLDDREVGKSRRGAVLEDLQIVLGGRPELLVLGQS